MKPLPHQERFVRGYKDKGLIVWEGGVGKTIAAALWLRDGRDSDALVVCPKRVVKKWQQELKDWGTSATVLSMEQFKKTPIHNWSARIIDEADEFASPLFTKGRSARSKALYELIKAYDVPTLLLTATPIRSNPWNLHTLLCYLRIYVDWKIWRDQFFSLERRPYIQFAAWFPKPDWRQKVRKILEKNADIVLLKDCVEYLPPVTENVIKIHSKTRFLGSKALTPTARFVEEHKFEQIAKTKKILEIGKEYRKVIVVAYYVDEIERLQRELSKDRTTFAIWGKIKDQEAVIKEAHEADECFFIVQASLGVGWDGDSFSCVVFTSMSYKVRDFVQVGFRVRRIKNLHPVEYNYLMGGRCDEAVYKVIKKGLDFVPSHWQS